MQNKPEKPTSTAPLIEGKFYWVKPYHGEEFEPAKCSNYYGNGNMYFRLTNGGTMEAKSVWEYKDLAYVEESTEPIKVQLTIEQLGAIHMRAKEISLKEKDTSHTVEIHVIEKNEQHLGGDTVNVYLKAKYNIKEPYKIY